LSSDLYILLNEVGVAGLGGLGVAGLGVRESVAGAGLVSCPARAPAEILNAKGAAGALRAAGSECPWPVQVRAPR